jgi:type II secretory pathway component GspD/PulD (secretin)
MTMDRETTVLIENLFGESIRLGGKSDDGGNVLPAFPGASLRDLAREKFGLKIGVSSGQEGHRFETLVDILVSRGYLKILMNPTLQAVNGQSARIEFEQHVPLQQITIQSGGFGGETVLRTQTEYYDIIDSLEITPHVYVDGHVGLDVQVQTSAHLAAAGVKQAPIVTSNAVANEASRIRLGESLIIGGMRKSERLAVTRGVPILKDIPVLNLLFSGRDFEERAKEVIFILMLTISTM